MATLGTGGLKRSLMVGLLLTASQAWADDLPRFTGSGSVTQAINGDTGAILDIGGGVTITCPKGIPVGRSRVVTFKKAAKKPTGAQIKTGFAPVGAALEFSLPVGAGDAPIVVSVPSKTDPRKRAEKLVFAMESLTLCTDENKATKNKSGLCLGWEVTDAQYESGTQQMVAKLQSTGGQRMQFGVMAQDSGNVSSR